MLWSETRSYFQVTVLPQVKGNVAKSTVTGVWSMHSPTDAAGRCARARQRHGERAVARLQLLQVVQAAVRHPLSCTNFGCTSAAPSDVGIVLCVSKGDSGH